MKMIREEVALLVIDIQTKLLPAMHDKEQVLKSADWMIRAAKELGVPIFFSEQYPKGLGETVAELTAISPESPRMEKMTFSCWENESIRKTIERFSQIVVIGIESHICVLQTVLDIQKTGTRKVFVVEQGVDSRDPDNKQKALARMQAAGAQIVSPEMFLCECIKTADYPAFRALSKTFLK